MDSTINLIGDPKYIGPGVWYLIHTKAKEATSDKTIEEFIDLMYMLEEKFACKNCRKHIGQYIDNHSFDDLIHLTNEDGTRIGMFKWAWLFHNAVNTRIGKPYVEWETAVEMFYKEQEVCSKKCEDAGDDHDDIPNSEPNKPNEPTDLPSELPTDLSDRKSKLAQGYFMSIGIPSTLKKNGIYTDTPNIPKRIQDKKSDVSWVNFATATN